MKNGSKMTKDQLNKLIRKELHEISYRQFTKEAKSRNSKEAVHKALKEVKQRLKEVNRLIEYTSRMKNELMEEGGDVAWKFNEMSIQQINEAIKEIYKKSKTL